jgi:uncharacterized protein
MSDTADESSICIGCGLCCDGTLYATATVRSQDVSSVIAAGLIIEKDEEREFFRQPCPRFSCGSCTVYEIRPKVCKGYRCSLLEKVEAGEISTPLAREVIEKALELRVAVRKIDPVAVTPSERTALAERLRGQLKGPGRSEAAHSLLASASLEHFLNRWFLKDAKKDPHSGETTL